MTPQNPAPPPLPPKCSCPSTKYELLTHDGQAASWCNVCGELVVAGVVLKPSGANSHVTPPPLPKTCRHPEVDCSFRLGNSPYWECPALTCPIDQLLSNFVPIKPGLDNAIAITPIVVDNDSTSSEPCQHVWINDTSGTWCNKCGRRVRVV